ncbi:hypothetical protein T10_3629, partial [Trichinella papuae]
LFSMDNLKYLGEVVCEIIFHDGHLERRFTGPKPPRKERIIGNSMSIPTIQVGMKTMLPSMPKESLTSGVDDLSSLKHQHCLALLGKYYQFLGQSTTFPELLSHITLETNHKANQCLYVSLAATEAEMEVLTGMLIKIGIISMPRYCMYWSNQTRVDAVANCMSRNRFEALLPAASGKHPSDLFRRKPEELKSEDEHIIPYKGRCKMKYYNLRKLDKWGLKLPSRC